MATTSTRLPRGAKTRAAEIDRRLAASIPHPVVELDHTSAWQLLVATILAAQSSDKMINSITPALFSRWPGPRDLAAADLAAVEEVIKSSGFFRQKARTIVAAAHKIATDFGGEVPSDIDLLVTVPGVGRKTANVVLGAAYRIASGIVVDTHVTRLAERLDLSRATDPVTIEQDLMRLFSRSSWIDISHRLVLHGRYVCKARSPDCAHCALAADLCPSAPRP
jgi:endonuclease III